jgi:hypothetical protein
MQRYTIPALLTLAIFTAFWAYTIIEDLIRVYRTDVTTIDLGVIFVLGLICGIALGMVPTIRLREKSMSS